MGTRVTTAHAIVRHLSRVRGVDMTEIRAAMDRHGIEDTTDEAVLAFIRSYTNIDVSASERAVNDLVMRHAVGCGARAVILDGFKYVIQGSAIASVVPHHLAHIDPSMRRGERRSKTKLHRVMHEVDA